MYSPKVSRSSFVVRTSLAFGKVCVQISHFRYQGNKMLRIVQRFSIIVSPSRIQIGRKSESVTVSL